MEPTDESATGAPACPRGEWPRRGVLWLELATAAYFLAPVALFLTGWLRPGLAWPLALSLAWLLLRGAITAARDAPRGTGTGAGGWRTGARLAAVALLCAAVVACTGVGGLTFRFADYFIYDAVLRMLVESPWPPGCIVPSTGDRLPAVYYFAYFLPPAAVGRLIGWDAAHAFHYLWNTLGVLLTVLWFLRLAGAFRLRHAILFLGFGGLDVIGYAATTAWPGGDAAALWDYATGTYWWSTGPGWMAHWSAHHALLSEAGSAESGGVFFRFYGPLSFLFDGPIHVLPAWVALMPVLHDAMRRGTVARAGLYCGALPLCSVFVAAGTLPMLAVAAWQTRMRGWRTAGNLIVGPVIAGIAAAFFISVDMEQPQGYLWEFQRLQQTWPMLALHYACAFGIYAAVAPLPRTGPGQPGRAWFWGAVAVFAAAPWYRMGVFNDFTTKVVIPAQLVFLVCLAGALRHPAGRWSVQRRVVLAALLVLGAWSATGIVHRAWTYGFRFDPPPMERVVLPAEEYAKQRAEHRLRFHTEAFFWRRLARPVEFQPPPPNDTIRLYRFDTPDARVEDWVLFSDEVLADPDGLRITLRGGDTPLLRRYRADIDADRVGSVAIDHTLLDADGLPVPHRLVLLWADPAHATPENDWWPFPRWRAAVLHPAELPITSNPYWRGPIEQFAVYLHAPAAPPGAPHVLTLRALRFSLR